MRVPHSSSRRALFSFGVAAGLVVTVLLVLYFLLRDGRTAGDASPVVEVEQGALRGEWVRGATGGGFQYAAFRWIPYAEPPLKTLRFKEPRPALPWQGVRDVTKEGKVCFQRGNVEGQFIGSEDCLVLNVFTPRLPVESNVSLPVLVFIHGGAFVTGSPSIQIYGPDFLVAQDIVVVTVAYRVNVFGFLCLENADVPGNVGLKDTILALQWVHRNVHKFGGDPAKVTIQGQSAGAAVAHWLTLLPETEGLFRAAITQSGSALQGLGYIESNLEYARRLGEVLVGPGASIEETSRRVMEAAPEELLGAAMKAAIYNNSTVPGDKYNELTMQIGLSPQRDALVSLGEPRLVLRDPESLILNRTRSAVPLLMGIDNREWLLFWYRLKDYPDEQSVNAQINNLVSNVPLSIIPYRETQQILGIVKEAANYSYEDIAEKLKASLFDPPNVDGACDQTCRLKKYQDKIHIDVDMSRLVRMRALQKEKTFLYKFNVKSDYNRDLPGETAEEKKSAVTHGDEMGYLFHRLEVSSDFNGSGLAPKTMRRMVKMWTNYVKFLDPTPDRMDQDPEVAVKWEPYEVMSSGEDTFLSIGEDLVMRREYIAGEEMPFWLNLYKSYRENKSL